MDDSEGADTIRSLGMHLQPFDYASHTDDVGIEWRKWLKSFETMVRASRIDDEEWMKDLLLHFAGPNVQQLFDTLPELPDSGMRGPLMNVDTYTPNMSCYEEAVTRLNAFFLPKENTTYERHLLRQMKQRVDESIDSFTVRLRVQAERCGFGDKVEENVKDQIIESCQSAVLRRDLLKRGDADLQEILRVAKIFETVAVQVKSFAKEALKPLVSEVNKIDVKPSYDRINRFIDSTRVEYHRCGYSGHMARDEKCPARGKSCNKCGGRDHFAKKCRKRKQPIAPTVNRDVVPKSADNGSDGIRNQESNSINQIVDKETEYIFNMTTSENDGEVQCEIGGVAVSAIIDSGSKYNLLSELVWEQMKSKKLNVSNQSREVSRPSEFMVDRNCQFSVYLLLS
ncbi:uncharacterized protein LOC129773799 [Toxorhynchites rutilus septentrionalis]|uniref:uncharacterized protein LOC129773799 n=1 Tax=Toxorhynchites rutilus septentrionalis TaxID=329112 RepID=UPI00247A6894|nr:uncharacterized protein LOC129773799 [Toxorhynchites rutilus septentrionalis]